MTRINLLPPKLLTDQHLLAEKKEINQLAGQLLKSLRSPNFSFYTLPEAYVLGRGHVRFWYARGDYIRKRYKQIYDECLRRNFKVQDNFNDAWLPLGPQFNQEFIPDTGYKLISAMRIAEKIREKPDFYRYCSKKIVVKDYLWALKMEDAKWIRTE